MATAEAAAAPQATATVPKILVFSTHNISDPGIDLAGSSHLHYSPGVVTISVPCSSLLRADLLVYAFEQGFDGVFIASDGEECAYLSDCAERSAREFGAAQARMRELGYEPDRLKMAAVCSVCAEPFTRYMHEFDELLRRLGPVKKRE
jgi:F420-non-reducing hydrogenase iron-sulfur subunit